MPSPSITFNHGVASGDPYPNSVILWTRVTPLQGTNDNVDGTWQASLSTGFEPSSIVDSGTVSTSAARDWTVKVEADGLKPDTTYHYRFLVGDVESMVGQTKTLPVGGDPVRLAVFSCANFTAAEQFAAYGRAAAINAVNPYDALVHLGDYIYEYGKGGYEAAEAAATDRGFLPNREIVSLDDYRQRYAQYHTDQNLQALRATAPLIAIWDDHETANDSWSGGAENHQPGQEGDWTARRDAALKAYYEWLPIREPLFRQGVDKGDASTPLSQGYRSFNFGDVLALHVLETRLTARDEQLEYPDAAAVQARIGAILSNPTELVAYAGKYGLTPPATQQAIPAFAAALAPAVTQELVLATVQKAWGDPSRDLIGDTQLDWLQKQMAGSNAAWQVLGQQVLMQSMAVPAELLLDPSNPTLLDKYAAPLQKLATGTPFTSLSAAEQALFAESSKIPYNLDAWDGYGVERETILQSALGLGKRLISLAGDTHNAWAGVLDTMTSAGTKPAGTAAGVEFATPGVTSPGFEKYLPGADAYIRAKYPAVDGLDGLFLGYVNGLKYADLNRRGFLDLTVTPNQATGSFQLLDGVNPLTGQPLWASETVVAASNLNLTTQPEVTSAIAWDPAWGELDLVVGTAIGLNNSQTLLDPAAYASLPRSGVQLADVEVQGSTTANRIFAGIGSVIDAAGGNDELFNSDSLGDNLLIGGLGSDSFYLNTQKDRVIGGTLLNNGALLGLADGAKDLFYLDLNGSSPISGNDLQILDYEVGIDRLLIDGAELATSANRWQDTKNILQSAGVKINAAPVQSAAVITQKLALIPGLTTTHSLSEFAKDHDGDALRLLVLSAPSWFGVTGSTLTIKTPEGFTADQLAALSIQLGLSDGKSVTTFSPQLQLGSRPPAATDNQPIVGFTDPQGNVRTFAVRSSAGSFTAERPAQLLTTASIVNSSSTEYQRLITGNGVDLATRSIDFAANVTAGTITNVAIDLAGLADGIPQGRRLVYYAIAADRSLSPLTYNPRERGGARFYDLDDNGRPDFLSLRLTDGGYGDKDGDVNGIIDDPSTAGSLDLNPVFSRVGSQTITAADPLKALAPASLVLKASLSARTSAVQQIGYVVLEPGELPDADALLADLGALRSRSQILFSSLESSDVVLHPDAQFTREFLLVNGQSTRFFQINDATLDDLKSAADPRLQFFSTGNLNSNNTFVSLSTSAGVRFNLELLNAEQGLNAMIAQEQGLAAVLDFTAFTAGQQLSGTLIMGREADLDSLIGFYRVVDTQGTVRDQNGNLVRTGEKSYKDAALLSQNRIDALTGLAVGDNQTSKRALELSNTGYLAAPFMQVQSNTFFAFAEANKDGYAHFKVLGTNLFGAEDLFGGGDRDHDDLVFGFSFNQVTNPIA